MDKIANTKHPNCININAVNIPLSTSVKYLGVIIDNKLNWNEHIHDVVNKCKRAIFAIKRTIGRKWGLSPDKMLWVYKTVIIPKITYACVVWASNLTDTQVSKLNTIQSLAAKLITRSNSRTPSK